jgi:hypothetical protein
VCLTTSAQYRGLPVAVFGLAGDTLLAVAALGTSQK